MVNELSGGEKRGTFFGDYIFDLQFTALEDLTAPVGANNIRPSLSSVARKKGEYYSPLRGQWQKQIKYIAPFLSLPFLLSFEDKGGD
jgi:hypothetical protein